MIATEVASASRGNTTSRGTDARPVWAHAVLMQSQKGQRRGEHYLPCKKLKLSGKLTQWAEEMTQSLREALEGFSWSRLAEYLLPKRGITAR